MYESACAEDRIEYLFLFVSACAETDMEYLFGACAECPTECLFRFVSARLAHAESLFLFASLSLADKTLFFPPI